MAVEAVVLAGVGHRLAGQQPSHETDRLDEAVDPDPGGVERQADLVVLRLHVAGAHAELEATAGERVEGGDLAGEPGRVVEVVVEHERAEAQAST